MLAAAKRVEHESRLHDERRRAERGKSLIVLVLHHLAQSGYVGSIEALQSESGVTLSQYEAADNVDLVSILQEWEDYYEFRFSRRAKLVKKLSAYSNRVDPHGPRASRRGVDAAAAASKPKQARPATKRETLSSVDDRDDGTVGGAGAAGRRARPTRGEGGPSASAAERALTAVSGGGLSGRAQQPKGLAASAAVAEDPAAAVEPAGLALTGTNVAARRGDGGCDAEEAPGPWEHRLKKTGLPPGMAASPELRELAAVIQRDMVQSNPNVRWDRIVELEGVKRVLKESLVMPLRWPHLFTGLLAPWKGVLLYGPPGTGKTLLAKAVATECSTVFFNISASSIVSKWRGDSEKLARHHAPSTIFIDEIDSIMSARGDSGEHEGSRRMKTELLVQMDGLMANEAQVFVLAATNLPWELDAALLRRLEKRVLVPLPSSSARAEMLRNTLPPARIQRSVDIDGLADQADGYSGSDLVLVCKEAAMRPLRKLLLTLDAADAAMGSGKVADLPQPERVTEEDLRAAFACTRPTVSQYGSRYAEWEAEFGSS